MSRLSESLQPELYGGLPGYKVPGTSKDAAIAVKETAAALREAVYAVFLAAGGEGRTPDEVASSLGKSVLAIRPRCSELLKAGRLDKTGKRRANDTGLKASVLRAVDNG